MTEIDERYKRGVIYTIRNITDDTLMYVGSTINNLSKRFNSHKLNCKSGMNVSLYQYIENNDWTCWYIELYENYPCNNKQELNRREGQVIREIGSINKNIAGRTQKEYDYEYYKNNTEKIKEQRKMYREQAAEKIKEKEKMYREKNAEKIKERAKEKVSCRICGTFSTKTNLSHHQKSKKCHEFTHK
jgi:hypothetical protein